MTNRVLEAYEGIKREQRDSFIEILKKGQRADQLFAVFYLVISIATMIVVVMDKQKILLGLMLALFIGLCIWTIFSRYNTQKRWNENVRRYNESLDGIKEILMKSEYNLYEKNKLKQLIAKFNRDIIELEKEHEMVQEKFNHYSSTYIIPIVAFCAGKLFEDITADEIIVVLAVGIAFLFLAKAIGFALGIIKTEIVEDNELDRKRYFVRKLQDLLDRDFEIDDNDLIR